MPSIDGNSLLFTIFQIAVVWTFSDFSYLRYNYLYK